MSHRTDSLPEASAPRRAIRELRYNEPFRQLGGIGLMIVFAVFAQPIQWLYLYAAVPLIVIGTGIRLWASGCIIKNRQLATTGPYAWVRHPLYTGNVLVLVGFVLGSATWWSAAAFIAFFWFSYPTAVRYEDGKLRDTFGETWEHWKARTPAIVPTRLKPEGAGIGDWSWRKSLLKNGEPLIAALVLFWAGWIGTRLG